MYQIRTYRSWVEEKELVSFEVKIEESDLFIRADKPLATQARLSLLGQRRAIQDYIRGHAQFCWTLEPYAVEKDAPAIVRDMAEAGFSAQVGPMAAVAGAVAEYVGRDLLQYSAEVIVENGGDIFIQSNKIRRVGIFAGTSCLSGKLALELAPDKEGLGVCTSSGTVGPSLSFGKVDAAVVIGHSATLADAWATRLGNEAKTANDVDTALNLIKAVPGIKGAVVIIGEKIGVWGEVKLVYS